MTVFRESCNYLSLLPSANGQEKFRSSMLNVCYAAWTREEVSQRRRPNSENTVQSSKELDIMNQINLQNRLAVSNGTVKNGQSNAMQPASQTTENGQAEKKRLGLLAVLAVGVDAASSFLKSKMEKAVSAAAAAVFVGFLAKQPKKTRFASIPLFALLAAFFIASPQGMAGYRGYWAPKYDEQYYNRTTHVWINIPFTKKRIRTVNLSRNKDKMKSDFWSKYYKPDSIIIGQASETIYKNDGATYERRELTTHYRSGAIATWGFLPRCKR